MNFRKFFTLLNLHIAGAVILLGINLFLLTRLFLAWHAASSDQSADYDAQHMMYMQLQSQMSRLQGLPQKVDQAHTDADKFSAQRIAPNYSTMAGELGALASKSNVRWTRAQYTQVPAINGLTEVRIDASVSGEYTQLMRFINGIERDKDHVFFIINTLAFNGQQGGTVNVRLRLTTYLLSGRDIPASTGEQTPPNTQSAALQPDSTEVR